VTASPDAFLADWQAYEAHDRTCFHEAGHAVVAMALGLPVYGVVVGFGTEDGVDHGGIMYAGNRKRRRRRDGGVYVPRASDLTEIGRTMAVDFAGYLAERRRAPTSRRTALAGALDDFAKVERWNPFAADWYCPEVRRSLISEPKGWNAFVREWLWVSRRAITRYWLAVEEDAGRLQDWHELTGPQLRGVARRHKIEPPDVERDWRARLRRNEARRAR
jgi:hypothetical protein